MKTCNQRNFLYLYILCWTSYSLIDLFSWAQWGQESVRIIRNNSLFWKFLPFFFFFLMFKKSLEIFPVDEVGRSSLITLHCSGGLFLSR